jgi:hypothetical protein
METAAAVLTRLQMKRSKRTSIARLSRPSDVRNERARERAREDLEAETALAWPRGLVLPLARERCRHCAGFGFALSGDPCGCVLRAITRRLVGLWRTFTGRPSLTPVRLGTAKQPFRNDFYGRPGQEFVADLESLARRVLTPHEVRLFRLYHLAEGEGRSICRRLRLNEGAFWHSIYRLEAKLGRAARELKPYALFPVYEYFRN